jgi:hypothetical protein
VTLRHRNSGRDSPDESGVILIFVLAFVLGVGLALASLMGLASSSILNSNNLATQRSIDYAADGAITVAVQSVRYSGNDFSPSDYSPCMPSAPPVVINGQTIYTTCIQQLFNPSSGTTRVINFYACTDSACTSSTSLAQARVTFDDYSTGNTYVCTYEGDTSTCGSSMTVNSWTVNTGTS